MNNNNKMQFIPDCDLTRLLPYKRNPRLNDQAVKAVSESIGRFGAIAPIIVDKDFNICVGHTRYKAALERGNTTFPVLVVPHLVGDEFKAYNIADNQTATIADWDIPELAAIIKELEATEFPVDVLGFDDAELRNVFDQANVNTGLTDPDDVPELPEEPVVKTGDLWLLGEHRLICGDCTDAAIVERVMGREKAQLVVTSPPYAVGKEYEAGISFAQHIALIEAMADMCIENVVAGGFIFINFGEIASQSHAGPLTGSKRQCIYLISKDYWRIFHDERHCDLYAQRIWYKPFHRLQQPFWTYHTSIPHYQEWEHIWTWRTPGGDGDRVCDWDVSVHAIWDTRNEATDDKPLTRHVAAFPVCLPERAIRAHSLMNEVILESFSGSGTTIIACEQLGRKCYAMEIEPRYVQVSLERYAAFTGKMPVLERTGQTLAEIKQEKMEAIGLDA